jgi:hypothetical protein
VILFSDDILKLVDELDKKYLLYTDTFSREKKRIEDEFSCSPVRKAFLAGKSYPQDPDEIKNLFDHSFKRFAQDRIIQEEIKGIIVPHIDLQRGASCYFIGYKELSLNSRPDIFLILGVAHQKTDYPYILTKKSFQIPLGKIESDGEFINKLCSRYKHDLFQDEILHRTEHSIEFQLLFLKYLFRHEFRVVPILCGHFEQISGQKSPSSCPEIEDFITALRDTIKRSRKKICLISGSDLSHLGPRFGDQFPVTDHLISWMKFKDEQMFETIKKCDAEEFYELCMEDKNKRRICGLSSIYTMMRLLKDSKVRILKYDSAPDPAGGIVSFASVVFI